MKLYVIPFPKDFNYLYSCPRSIQMAKEGLEADPDVQFVDKPEDADYFLLNYVPHSSRENKWDYSGIRHYDFKRTIVLDFVDEYDRLLIPDWFIYFKRSWLSYKVVGNYVAREKFYQIKEDFLPIQYGILNDFPRQFVPMEERTIDVGCYHRGDSVNRRKILAFAAQERMMSEYNYHVGPVSNDSRSSGSQVTISKSYFETLGTTKIYLHGTTDWIGDSRIAEALVSGCLLFTEDIDFRYHQSITVEHAQFYEVSPHWDLREHINYYLSNPEEAEKISRQGQQFALNNMTSSAIMSYVVESIKDLENEREAAKTVETVTPV